MLANHGLDVLARPPGRTRGKQTVGPLAGAEELQPPGVGLEVGQQRVEADQPGADRVRNRRAEPAGVGVRRHHGGTPGGRDESGQYLPRFRSALGGDHSLVAAFAQCHASGPATAAVANGLGSRQIRTLSIGPDRTHKCGTRSANGQRGCKSATAIGRRGRKRIGLRDGMHLSVSAGLPALDSRTSRYDARTRCRTSR